MAKNQMTGYVESIRTPDNYVLGYSSLPQKVLQPNGQWLDFLPDFESQFRQIETYNCTSFNTLNCIEQIMFNQFGEVTNYSDRWLGIKSGTYPPGNDPHTVAECLRHNGTVPEEMCPFSKDLQTVDEYFSYKGVDPEACNAKGKAWLKEYKVGHEWVDGDTELMMEALKFSPLAIAVDAWNKEGDYYVRKGPDNHWTCIVGYVKDEYWIVYDSYMNDGETIKKLKWSFGFSHIKRYHVEKSELVENLEQQVSLLQKIINLLKEWISLK